ncbi:hypothetical protein Vadar_025988 [Vaccinium darrowii]|uniref:Uncharacterized protein n=1 Tax=Vaccinium darrowii TaxID=229202 RepID=A0ACB7X4F8_9ERIC|nr:hypothetical protein Vadar_025988 [Vaccinium darrowii]
MCNLDLRFVVPALINLTLFLLQHNPPILDMNSNNWFFSIVIILTLIIFLITSVKLPLSVTAQPIQVRAGDFSSLLVISLLASVFLPQPLFWFGYVILLCLSPWHGYISDFLVGFLFRIWNILRAIPVLIIACVVHNHQQEERETDNPPQVQVVVVADEDIGGNPILLEHHSSELDAGPAVQP